MMNQNMMGPPPAAPPRERSGLRRALSGYSMMVRRNWHNFRYRVGRFYVRNPASRKRFAAQPPKLSPVEQKAVDDLKANGIAILKLDDLLGPANAHVRDEMIRFAEEFAAQPKVRDAEEKLATGQSRGVAKEFIVKKYAPGEARKPDDPLFRFGLRSEILNIVNSYAGMWTRYKEVELLYNMALREERARSQSQNWHRDYTDEPTIKVFLYFRDVHDKAGPLEYIPGSRAGGPYAHLWPQPGWFLPEGYYPKSEVVEATVPPQDRMKCCVPALTLVICDTSGFHRGGYAISDPRLAGVWMYLTPAALEKRLFAFEQGAWMNQLPAAAQFALA